MVSKEEDCRLSGVLPGLPRVVPPPDLTLPALPVGMRRDALQPEQETHSNTVLAEEFGHLGQQLRRDLCREVRAAVTSSLAIFSVSSNLGHNGFHGGASSEPGGSNGHLAPNKFEGSGSRALSKEDAEGGTMARSGMCSPLSVTDLPCPAPEGTELQGGRSTNCSLRPSAQEDSIILLNGGTVTSAFRKRRLSSGMLSQTSQVKELNEICDIYRENGSQQPADPPRLGIARLASTTNLFKKPVSVNRGSAGGWFGSAGNGNSEEDEPLGRRGSAGAGPFLIKRSIGGGGDQKIAAQFSQPTTATPSDNSQPSKLRKSWRATPESTKDKPTGLVPGSMHHIGFHSEHSEKVKLFHIVERLASMCVRSFIFEFVAAVLIFLNAVVVGAQTDHMARNLLDEPPPLYQTLDKLFCIFFTVELSLRLFVYRAKFFRMYGCGWNIMDLSLVSLQLFEEILDIIIESRGGTGGGNDWLSNVVLRVIRVLRTLKVIRVLRVMRFMSGLRLLVCCCLHSVRSFVWACSLLFLMIYVVSTYITQTVLAARIAGTLPDHVEEDLFRWYGNLLKSLLSIFQGLTGGVDWNELVNPIMYNISPIIGFMMVMFIAFVILSILNVVTGIFVQSAIERAGEVERLNKVDQARKLFKIIDLDNNGNITFEELEAHLDLAEVIEFFQGIDVDITDAKDLFDLLDFDSSGSLEFEEFLSGCIRLQGPAKALDMLIVHRDTRQAFEQQDEKLDFILSQVQQAFHLPAALQIASMSQNQIQSQQRASNGIVEVPEFKSAGSIS